MGNISFPAIQAAPSLSYSFPQIFGGEMDIQGLIPCAINKDPYFRMTRYVTPRIFYPKPPCYTRPSSPPCRRLRPKGVPATPTPPFSSQTQPSRSRPRSTSMCFLEGKTPSSKHKQFGENGHVDVSFMYMTFFLEDEDKLEQIRKDYSSGAMLTWELKKELVEVLHPLLAEHQSRCK
ncbi:Tryptophanyl-tRNA synthetase, cytoplasmic [Myotis davidii]|uniref:Tryptophanyl-tRNA synthetase n=1 Tax=Myotis davidii TaxID=225400 RepID=L5MDZ3_MYODS|nr:Tryptophanyl-tRNA synthetase, cytoplasmic [Myotis davidii]